MASIVAGFDVFYDAYVRAALWSTNDETTPSGGVPLDQNYGPEDIAPETAEKMRADCVDFYARFVFDSDDMAGHDFWLTRNGHGSGFWDGDWSEPEATRYTEAAKSFGEYSLYVGDDGRIWGSGK